MPLTEAGHGQIYFASDERVRVAAVLLEGRSPRTAPLAGHHSRGAGDPFLSCCCVNRTVHGGRRDVQDEQPPDDRRARSRLTDTAAERMKFAGRAGVVYTVAGKGGLVREVLLPYDLAERFEALRRTPRSPSSTAASATCAATTSAVATPSASRRRLPSYRRRWATCAWKSRRPTWSRHRPTNR